MSSYIRPRRPGATVFFTVGVATRGTDLLVRHIDVLRDVARRTLRVKPFRIEAWVVLPDHMHCVWTLPDGDVDYSNRMGMLKARFSRQVRRSGDRAEFLPAQKSGDPTPGSNPFGVVAGRVRGIAGAKVHAGQDRVGVAPDLRDETPIWQKRFWEHHIRDEADLRAHVRYCWINPVKHGLVEHPWEWPYSSWHRDGGEDLTW